MPDNVPTLNADDEALLEAVEDDGLHAKLAERLALDTAPADTGPRSPRPDRTQGMDRTKSTVSNREIAGILFEEFFSDKLR